MKQEKGLSGFRGGIAIASMGILIPSLSACVQVEAPDKPIVIELNMNIRQEVVYRIAREAEALIEEREDIF